MATIPGRNHRPGGRVPATRSKSPRRSQMDCKSFTSKHAAFIDDTLPGVDMAGMRAHINECMRCARRDADVRRALLLVRNLPQVQVSEGFQDRLRARLATETAVPAMPRAS